MFSTVIKIFNRLKTQTYLAHIKYYAKKNNRNHPTYTTKRSTEKVYK